MLASDLRPHVEIPVDLCPRVVVHVDTELRPRLVIADAACHAHGIDEPLLLLVLHPYLQAVVLGGLRQDLEELALVDLVEPGHDLLEALARHTREEEVLMPR